MKKHSLSDVGGRREEDRKLLIKSGQSQLGRSFFFLFSFFNFTRNEISVPAPEEKRERSRSFLSFFRLALALSQVQGVVFVCTQCI